MKLNKIFATWSLDGGDEVSKIWIGGLVKRSNVKEEMVGRSPDIVVIDERERC